MSNPAERNWKERDSGLSQSLLGGGESQSQSEDLKKLLEECKTTLGITESQDGDTSTAGKSTFVCLFVCLGLFFFLK